MNTKFINILQQNGITVKGRKILCPFHEDRNPSMIINEGNLYCFACGRAYSFNEYLERAGIEERLNETLEAKIHRRLNKILENYLSRVKAETEKDPSYQLKDLLNRKRISLETLLSYDTGLQKALTKDEEDKLLDLKNEIIDLEKDNLQPLAKRIDELLKLLSRNDNNNLLLFYRNENFYISGIKARKCIADKGRKIAWSWRKGKRLGLFGLKSLGDRPSDLLKRKHLLAVEGEFNLMVIHEASKNVGLNRVDGFAVGASSDVDVETLSKLISPLKNEGVRVYYFYDNDEPGFKAILDIATALGKVYAFTTPDSRYNDAEDWRNSFFKDEEFIKALLEQIKQSRPITEDTKIYECPDGQKYLYVGKDSFVIEDDKIRKVRVSKDGEVHYIDISLEPIFLLEQINRYGQAFVKIAVCTPFGKRELFVPKKTLLAGKIAHFLASQGISVSTNHERLLKEYFMHNLEITKAGQRIDLEPVRKNGSGIWKGDILLKEDEDTGEVKEFISLRENGIKLITQKGDTFVGELLTPYCIADFKPYENLLTEQISYEIAVRNPAGDIVEKEFSSFSAITREMGLVDRRKREKIQELLKNLLEIVRKEQNIEKKLPAGLKGFYIKDGKLLYNGEVDKPERVEVALAYKSIEKFISYYKNRDKVYSVLYAIVSSAFSLVRKQLFTESKGIALTGVSGTGKTTMAQLLAKIWGEVYAQTGASINTEYKLARVMGDKIGPVVINEASEIFRNTVLHEILKNALGQDVVIRETTKNFERQRQYSVATPVFTLNTMPAQLEDAIIRRLITFRFEKKDKISPAEMSKNARILEELSQNFPALGKAIIHLVLENGEYVIELVKSSTSPRDYLKVGKTLLEMVAEQYKIKAELPEPIVDDMQDDLMNESELVYTRLANSVKQALQSNAKKYLPAMEYANIFTKHRSIAGYLRELWDNGNTEEIRKLLSVLLPEYFEVSVKNIYVKREMMDSLGLQGQVSGGFKRAISELEQWGFEYYVDSRRGIKRKVGKISLDKFLDFVFSLFLIDELEESIEDEVPDIEISPNGNDNNGHNNNGNGKNVKLTEKEVEILDKVFSNGNKIIFKGQIIRTKDEFVALLSTLGDEQVIELWDKVLSKLSSSGS